MSKRLLICLGSLLMSASVFAQAPGSAPVELSDEAGMGYAELAPSAGDLASEVIASKGWIQGYDTQSGKYIAVGVGAIPVAPSHPAFGQERAQAFKKAMLDVKTQMAGYMAAEVSRQISDVYAEPNLEAAIKEQAAQAEKEPGVMDKSIALINAELDRLLEERNVDMSQPKKIQAEVKQILVSDTFSDAIQASAKAEVAGLQVYKIIEAAKNNTGEVAVIAIFSPKSKQMAAALLGKGPAPMSKAKTPISTYAQGLDPIALISTHGVKPRTDENGNLTLVAFGQAFPRTSSSTSINGARNKAKTQALGYLRSFAGEMVATRESSDDASTFQEYADGTSEYASSDAYEKSMSARAASLRMPGISTVRSWKAMDSRSGKMVVGTIIMWNLGSAKDANALRDQMTSLGGSKGGAGVTAKPQVASKPTMQIQAPKADDSPFTTTGVGGDDDDF